MDVGMQRRVLVNGEEGSRETLTFAQGDRAREMDPVTAAITELGGTSIFDPVLCEIAYRWFCPPDGMVLDPFAGGSVRGIVASRLGRHYVGIDLRPEQVDANFEQIDLACEPQPEWRCGDAVDIEQLAGDVEADLIFSCPPYWNLEIYSDDAADLSNMGLEQFLTTYRAIIAGSAARLRNDRFAVWVVGDVRDKNGFYVNLPGHTVGAFEAAGLRLYNEAILVTAVSSLPLRVARQFEQSRKLGHTHQYVQVYVKGDPVVATKACGPVEFGEILTEAEQAAAHPAVATRPPGNGGTAPALAVDGLGGEV